MRRSSPHLRIALNKSKLKGRIVAAPARFAMFSYAYLGTGLEASCSGHP
jgi:hypothetical protein